MITKSELQAVYRDMIADDRHRLGDPPTVEELLAWERGDLSAEESARVRELLDAYPELARALATPFPTDDPRPGEPDFVTDEKLASQWAALRTNIGGAAPQHAAEARVLRFWRGAALALAALLVLAFGAGLRQRQTNSRLMKELVEPRLRWEEQVLEPGGRRGGGSDAKVLSTAGDLFYLVGPIRDRSEFNQYRVEIVGREPQRLLWSSSPQRNDNETFAVIVPHAFMPAGDYDIVLKGINGAREEKVDTFPVRVPEQ
jgi:hypothetical protein